MTDERKTKEYHGVTIEPCSLELGFRTVKGWRYVDRFGHAHKSTTLRVIKQMIDVEARRRRTCVEPTPTGFRAVYERHDGPQTRYLTESERLRLRQCTGKVRSVIVDPVALVTTGI